MPRTLITEQLLREFFRLCKEGMTQLEAAQKLGRGHESFRKAAERLEIDWPRFHKSYITEQIAERKDEIIKSSEGQKYWAKEFNTSNAYISFLFTKFGISAAQRGTRNGIHKAKKIENARKVIGYITANGGNVVNAIKVLGLKVSQPQYIRDFGRECGFDFYHYLYAWRTFGDWITIPGPVRQLNPPQNIMVPAVCTRCGNIKQLNLTNAKTGRTTSCRACANGHGRRFEVKDTTTGEIFKSVMAFAKAKGLSSRYQTARVKLIADGSYTLNGITYELIRQK